MNNNDKLIGFEDKTNGEVIMTLFPKCFTSREKLREPDLIRLCSDNGRVQAMIYEDWWNAPYKENKQ